MRRRGSMTMPRSGPKFDLKGKRFGRWLVSSVFKGHPKHGYYWLCRCDCGTERYVRSAELTTGRSLGCGCLRNHVREKPDAPLPKTVDVQYRWYNKSVRAWGKWDDFDVMTESNAAKMVDKSNNSLQYRIAKRKCLDEDEN